MQIAPAVNHADVVAWVGGQGNGTTGHRPNHRRRVIMTILWNKNKQILASDGAAAHFFPQFLAVAAEDIESDLAGECFL